MEFTLSVTWRSGIMNELDDMLSRFLVWPANTELEDPNFKHVCSLIKNDFNDPIIESLVLAAKQDPSYRKLKEAIRSLI